MSEYRYEINRQNRLFLADYDNKIAVPGSFKVNGKAARIKNGISKKIFK
ncbi:MAG: hypothetical protein KAS13_02125 [Candidatus Omnitrophica bacterium]|nr:hypothetical protein [Candidatus Omnitrophota bacterium]